MGTTHTTLLPLAKLYPIIHMIVNHININIYKRNRNRNINVDIVRKGSSILLSTSQIEKILIIVVSFFCDFCQNYIINTTTVYDAFWNILH
jgi:hypothetical protein